MKLFYKKKSFSFRSFYLRLKKEAIEYLFDLAVEFRHNTKSQISTTIKRVIHENFYLNNQMDYLSNQLEKSIEMNKTSTEHNQHLTRTIAILEDVEIQSSKKDFATENVCLQYFVLEDFEEFAICRLFECCVTN